MPGSKTHIVLEWRLGNISKPWAGAATIWVGVIFFSSTNLAERWADSLFAFFTGQISVPHPDHGTFFLVVDKSFHVTIFVIFALLLSQALRQLPRRAVLVAVAGAILGCCSEYLQSFFPGRDPAIHDVFINLGGTLLGIALYSRFDLKLSGAHVASTELRVPAQFSDDGR